MEIREDDLSGPEVQALLRLHLSGMHESSPPDSVHALDIDGLRGPDVTFWSVWEGRQLLGFGALKALDAEHGEIKSMRTAPGHLRKGVAAALLSYIVGAARKRAFSRLSLETGSGPAFEPAHALYRRFGFDFCDAFGAYSQGARASGSGLITGNGRDRPEKAAGNGPDDRPSTGCLQQPLWVNCAFGAAAGGLPVMAPDPSLGGRPSRQEVLNKCPSSCSSVTASRPGTSRIASPAGGTST